MPRYVAFLRGMNIGGRRITNEELATRFAALELEEVQTFRASGNVIFSSHEGDEATLQAQLEDGLAAALAYDVPTFLRSGEEIERIVAGCPIAAQSVAASEGKLQVALLASAPEREVQVEVLALGEGEEELGFAGRELYWLPSGPMSASALDLKALERVLGRMTVRTMGTIEQIAARL